MLLCLSASAAGTRAFPQELPRFFRHFQSYGVYDNLTRAVHESGLTVVVEEHPVAPLAAVVTRVRTGWIESGDSEEIVLAERLLFVLDEAVGRVGGVSEYRADGRSVEMRSVIPAEEVGSAIRAHLRLLRVEETDFEPEKRRVAARLAERRSSPESRLRDEMRSAVFGEVPYPRSPKPMSDADLVELQRTHFHSGNVVLAVSGAVRREAVLRRVADEVAELGLTAGRGRESLGDAGGDHFSAGLAYRQATTTLDRPVVLMGFRVPGAGHPNRLALRLTQYLLAEGRASLLRLPRPEETAQPFEVFGFLESTSKGGLLWFALFPEEGLLERSEVRFLAALEALGRTPVPETLLGRAKALMVVDGLRRLETLSDRASALAEAEARGDLRSRDAFADEVTALSPDDIRGAVRKYLHRDNLFVVELRPSGLAPRAFTGEAYRETMDILVPIETEAELALLAGFSDDRYEGFRPPSFGSDHSSTELRRSSILRGPEIYLRERHALPLVHLGFFFAGGRISEQPDTAGITEILLRAMLHSRARRDGGRQIFSLEAEGVRIGRVNEPDFFGYQVVALSTAVPRVSRELVEWIRSDPELTPEDVERARLEARLASALDCGPCEERWRRAAAFVFGRHPYGFTSPGPCADGLDFSLEDVERWRRELIQGVNPYIVVSGDLRGTSFLQDLTERLSDPRFQNRRAVARRVEDTGRTPFVESSGEPTLLAFLGPGADSYYVEMLDVAASLLGGPSGLATRKLREEGLGYEARIVQRNHAQAGLLVVEAHAPADRGEEAAKAALAEMRAFSESPAELSRFYASLVQTITRFMARQGDPDRYLIDTMTAVLAGKPPDYARRYILNVKQMRMGEVESVIRRFLGGGE